MNDQLTKRLRIGIKSSILLILFVYLLGYLLTDNIQQDSKLASAYELRNEIRLTFMDVCAVDGDMYPYCSCIFNHIEDVYGLNRLVEIGEEVSLTGVATSEIIEASSHCVEQL